MYAPKDGKNLLNSFSPIARSFMFDGMFTFKISRLFCTHKKNPGMYTFDKKLCLWSYILRKYAQFNKNIWDAIYQEKQQETLLYDWIQN